MHHRKSPRASRIDYTASAAYFVTICTKDRRNYFGEIEKNDLSERQDMKLNSLGLYCYKYIQSLSEQRKTVDIHEWVVMPNHVHILLYLSEFTKKMNQEIQDTRRRDVLLERPCIETDTMIGQAKSLSLPINAWYNGPTLWSIINMFKGAITKYANQHNIPFARQSRYHDHLIRNESEYDKIKCYIQTNPQNRNTDTVYN